VVVVQCSAGEHGAVGVEGGADYRGGAVVVKEARVGLEGGEVSAVDVESLDLVAVCSPGVEIRHHSPAIRWKNTYMLKTGACS
jgi:hypothetical protein